MIVGWVEHGEDVVVKGESIARSEALESKVDWSKSSVFRRHKGEPVLTQQDLDELFHDMRGPY